MKPRLFIFSIIALCAFSCSKQAHEVSNNKGVRLTLEASGATVTKTTYVDNAETKVLAVNWEATEKISVISIGPDGITAIDEFTSTGETGREVAVFSGSWTGNEGDKVICLYPAVSTQTGIRLFTGATVGSTEIILKKFYGSVSNNSAELLKNFDVLLGDVNISGADAYVKLSRQIEVFRVTFTPSQLLHSDGDAETATGVTVSVTMGGVNAAIATKGTLKSTLSTYTGQFKPVEYGNVKYDIGRIRYSEDPYKIYLPIFSSGNLMKGQVLEFIISGDVRYYYSLPDKDVPLRIISKTLANDLPLEKGKIYNILPFAI